MINYLIKTPLITCSLILVLFSCTSRSAENLKNRDKKNHHQTFVSDELEYTQQNRYYQVTKVVDGDTFWIDNLRPNGLKIRFIGIDAPESRNAFKKKKQYYGKESKAYLTDLLQNRKVRLEFDVDSLDQFKRTLAYVFLENGDMVNELIIKSGNGILMTIPPNVKYEELLIKAQTHARVNNLGLWKIVSTEK